MGLCDSTPEKPVKTTVKVFPYHISALRLRDNEFFLFGDTQESISFHNPGVYRFIPRGIETKNSHKCLYRGPRAAELEIKRVRIYTLDHVIDNGCCLKLNGEMVLDVSQEPNTLVLIMNSRRNLHLFEPDVYKIER